MAPKNLIAASIFCWRTSGLGSSDQLPRSAMLPTTTPSLRGFIPALVELPATRPEAR